MGQLSEALSILRPTKKLSQLIAQSWLDGTRLSLDSQFLKKNDILSAHEAKFYNIVVDESPQGDPPYQGYTNAVTAEFYIPYPQRPEGVEDKDLKDWVQSSTDSPPWIPDSKTKLPWATIHIGRDPKQLGIKVMPFNFLDPNKKLSQLIAKSWLDGQRLDITKDWLLAQGIISPKEAQYYEIEVDNNPPEKRDSDNDNLSEPIYVGSITLRAEGGGKLHMYIPYPQRPDSSKVTNEDLEQWVNDSDPNHWLPANIWIPYSC